MKNELKVIAQKEIFGKPFNIYGDFYNPLFLAKEVAKRIEYNLSNVHQLVGSVDEDEKVRYNVTTLGGTQESWFLTEDGLYEVLMQSRKPIAKAFKKEVKTILKQIRLTGGYIPTHEGESEESIMARGYAIALKTIENNDRILGQQKELIEYKKKQIEKMKPKADFYDSFMQSDSIMSIERFAHVISPQLDRPVSRNKMFKILREQHALTSKNYFVESMFKNELVAEKVVTFTDLCGQKHSETQIGITPKGTLYILNRLILAGVLVLKPFSDYEGEF